MHAVEGDTSAVIARLQGQTTGTLMRAAQTALDFVAYQSAIGAARRRQTEKQRVRDIIGSSKAKIEQFVAGYRKVRGKCEAAMLAHAEAEQEQHQLEQRYQARAAAVKKLQAQAKRLRFELSSASELASEAASDGFLDTEAEVRCCMLLWALSLLAKDLTVARAQFCVGQPPSKRPAISSGVRRDIFQVPLTHVTPRQLGGALLPDARLPTADGARGRSMQPHASNLQAFLDSRLPVQPSAGLARIDSRSGRSSDGRLGAASLGHVLHSALNFPHGAG